MNIDERLERIGERLDAMAMNLELFERTFLDMMKKLGEAQIGLVETQIKLAETQAENAQATRNLVDVARMLQGSTSSLLSVTRSHEWRLNNLEGGKKGGETA